MRAGLGADMRRAADSRGRLPRVDSTNAIYAATICHHLDPGGVGGQYTGSDLSTWVAQAVTPPWTCTAEEKPAAFSVAKASADRTPLLQ